jgi:hypothetical protein
VPGPYSHLKKPAIEQVSFIKKLINNSWRKHKEKS